MLLSTSVMKCVNIVLCCFAILCSGKSEEQNDEEMQAENGKVHQEWFSKLTYHSTILTRCSRYAQGIPYRIPKRPDCSPPAMDKEPTTNVSITTYWADFKIQAIQATECFEETQKRFAYNSFFTDNRRYNEDKKYTDPYLPSDCFNLRRDEKTKLGETLEHISSGLKATKNNNVPEGYYFSDNHLYNKNTYMFHTDLTVNVRDNTIQVVGPVLTETCTVDKGYCKTTRGILIWDPEKYKFCRLKIGSTTTCIKTGSKLTCPQLSITISDMKLLKVCGIWMGSTGTGGFFTSQYAGEIFPKMKGTEDVKRELIPLINKPVPKRNKGTRGRRDVSSEEDYHIIEDPFMVTHVDYKLNQQYIIDAILSGGSSNYYNVHQLICRNNAMIIDIIYHQAAIGDANAMVKTLTGDNTYRATLHGDVLNVWKCEEIVDYQLEVRPEQQNCTLEWPVKYQGDDKKNRKAFISSITHQLVDEPTYVPCPAPPFYFETNEGLILLDQKRHIMDMDILPNPGESLAPSEKIKISFEPIELFTMDELSGMSFIRKQQEALSVATQIGKAVTKLGRGEPLTPIQGQYLHDMGNYWGYDFMLYIYVIISMLSIITIVAVIVAMITYRKQVGTGIKAFGAACGGLTSCCGICCGCKDKKEKRVNDNTINVILNPPTREQDSSQIIRSPPPRRQEVLDKNIKRAPGRRQEARHGIIGSSLNYAETSKYQELPEDVRRSLIYPALENDNAIDSALK